MKNNKRSLKDNDHPSSMKWRGGRGEALKPQLKFTLTVPVVKGKVVLALFLILISNLGWLLPITVVPFLKMDLEHKGFIVALCVIFGQITFNLGLLLAGAHALKLIRDKKEDIHLFWIQARLLLVSFLKYFQRKDRAKRSKRK
jgi:hypothetical protein